MNLPFEAMGGAQRGLPAAMTNSEAMKVFLVPESIVAPFEFRSLTGEDVEAIGMSVESWGRRQAGEPGVGEQPGGSHAPWGAGDDMERMGGGVGGDRARKDEALRDAARQEGFQEGNLEGRRAVRAEMEAETCVSVARERARVVCAVKEFGVVRERYFAGVEQEVVKLALAIAARVLHREAQIDPLLLAGVVRVALEKMQDRSGVVLRVAEPDGEAWERTFQATEPSERPRVVEDARLAQGECVLETKMGTVELGVKVQLEEIEKGFFDLLNHRPVE